MRLASDGRQRCKGERQVLDGVERSLRGRWERDLTAFRTVADVAIYFQQITPSQLPAIVVSRDERGNKKPPSNSTVVSVSESEIEKSYFFSATTLVNLPFSKASLPKTAST